MGGDFTFVGFGDIDTTNPDATTAGLAGLVRLNGDEEQSVTVGDTPNQYLHGLEVDGAGAALGSTLTLSTAATSALPTVGGPPVPNDKFDRDFGTLFLESGNVVTGPDSLIVTAPVPTGGGDLLQANNADDVSPPGTPGDRPSAVLGGSRNSHIIGTLTRNIGDTTPNTGGFVDDGYIYPLGNGENYRAIVVQPASDFGETQFFTGTLASDPAIDLPDGLTSRAEDPETGDEFDLNLDIQSEPYFLVNSEEVPNENVNVRVIAGGIPQSAISDIKQLRLVQFDTTGSGSVQEAGRYDIDFDPADDVQGGPNSFISGVPNVHHEGVDLREGNVIGLASQRSINSLGTEAGGVQLAGTVTYGGSDGAGGVEVTAAGDDTTATTTTDSTGAYSFAGLPADSYDVTASASGTPQGINATDALLAVQFFAGSASLSDFQQELADVNDSGNVNATDALLIAQFTAGNVSSFDAGTFASTTASVDASSGATEVGVEIGAYGDVNLSGGVGSSSSQSKLAVTKVEGSGSAPAKTASASTTPEGETISVPLSLDRSAELGAYTLSIDYPADKVSFEGVSSEDVLARDAGGTVQLAWFDRTGEQPMSLNAGEAFVTLRFAPAEGVENGSLEIKNIKGELAGADATTLSGVGLQVPDVGLGGPESFAFDGNYPNPVGERTTISFDLPEQANVSLDVYDVLGRNVMSIPKQSMSAGAGRSLSVDASDLSSGTYLYRLQVEMGDQTIRETGKMNVVK